MRIVIYEKALADGRKTLSEVIVEKPVTDFQTGEKFFGNYFVCHNWLCLWNTNQQITHTPDPTSRIKMTENKIKKVEKVLVKMSINICTY